jgi:tetratricopeptide (TPR) repeat protein
VPSGSALGTARAEQLHLRGQDANARGRFGRASQLLHRALAALEVADASGAPQPHDTEVPIQLLRARVQLTLAWSEAELHGFEQGLAHLAEVYRLLDAVDARLPGAGAEIRTPLHNQHGLLLLRAGRTAEALREFGAAERWFGRARALDQCNVLLNRGVLELNTMAIRSARNDFIRCATLAGDSDLPLLEFKARHNLGYLEFLRGDLPRSLQAMDEATALAVAHSRGVSLIDRAEVLVDAGLTRDADEALAEAIRLLRAERSSTHDLAEAELARGRCALQLGDWRAAIRFAGRAGRRFQSRDNPRRAASAALVIVSAEVQAGRRSPRLLDRAQALSAELADRGLRSEATTATLLAAELLVGTGRTDEAARALAELGRNPPGQPISVRMHARYVHARLAEASGSPKRAARDVRTGLAELVSYRSRFGSLDAITASAVHGVRLAELELGWAVASGKPATVLAAAERARAVSSRFAAVRPPQDERAATLLAELRQVVLEVRSADVHQPATRKLMQRRQELERAIKARSWATAGGSVTRRPVGLSTVQGALSESDAVLAMYLEIAGVLWALSIGPRRAKLTRLDESASVAEAAARVRADLDALSMRSLPAGIADTVQASLRRSLTSLDDALVRPLSVADRRVVVVLIGVLSALPWGSLPSLRSHPVTVVPSATAWINARVQPRRLDAAVVAVCGPDLHRAKDEVHEVAKAWQHRRPIVYPNASGRDVREALSTAGIVHVAAHGRLDIENPLFSAIRLQDGPLFAYDLVPELGRGVHVVLSACELGLAAIRPGDEPLGLTRALLYHGAAVVVSGVSRVADDVACEVMAGYHAALASGRPPAEALAAVTGEDRTAAFVCFGAGLIPLTS